MEYKLIDNFLANHGILMEMFLKDMVLACGLIAFLGGLFLGWVITEIRSGITWKAPLVFSDGKKWCVIEPPKEDTSVQFWKEVAEQEAKGPYLIKTCPTEGWGDGECTCAPKCV